jgi:hypothetical protein
VPQLHRAVFRDYPVVPERVDPARIEEPAYRAQRAEAARFVVNWASATGTAILLAAIASALLIAAPAAATTNPPVRDHVTVHNPLRDNGEHCGFPVLWDINMSIDRWTWRDDAGLITKQLLHIREDNTVHNLATGKVLRDGPVDFVRRHEYENGVRVRTTDTGVMVNIRDGRERLLDIGWVQYRVHPNGIWEIFRSGGHHPVFEVLDGNTFHASLGAFCGVLD